MRDVKRMKAIVLAAVIVVVAGLNSDQAFASNDPADRPLLFGVATEGGNVVSSAEIDDFIAEAGRPPALRMEFWGLDFEWPNTWAPNILTSHHNRGVTNVISVFHNNLDQINSGAMDSQIHAMAQTIADWVHAQPGRRVIVAPLPEPNLNHYNGANPASYKAAWKRIHDIIVSKGLGDSEVRFVFWLNGLTAKNLRAYSYADWYPGDHLADIIGHSKLNRNADGVWRDYDNVFTEHIRELQGFIGTHKPILVMETGTVGGTSAKNAWLTDMMTKLRTEPQVIGTIYFNRLKVENGVTNDFRILANGILRPPVKNNIGSWAHPTEVDWIFDGRMDDWVEWREQWLPERIWGNDRYQTSVEISQMIYPNGTDVVYLAVGTNYPDSMVAGGAAILDGAPVLLVKPTELPATTRAELLRLGPAKVVIVGGTGAISQGVANQVKTALPAVQIIRHSGPDRYATAVEVSKAAFPTGAGTVYVVTGENFPDALSATPPAFISGGPLLLVRQNSLPDVVASELARLGPDRIVIVGGIAAVSPAVQQALGAHASVVERISTPNRYATSAQLSKLAFPNGADVAYLALGTSFPDALSGGGTAGVAPGPMLLITSDSIPSEIAAELSRLKPSRIVVFGGPGVISQQVLNALSSYVIIG